MHPPVKAKQRQVQLEDEVSNPTPGRTGVSPQQTITERIAGDVRRDILAGTLGPGAKLPSEQAFRDRYGAARGTVRRALDVLVNEGLVSSQSGKGYFVREYAPLEWYPATFESPRTRKDTAEAGADAWAADVAEKGRAPAQKVEVAIVEPPPVAAEYLRIPDGDLVVTRRRVRLVDGTPYHTADSYYPRDVAEGTPIMQAGDIAVPGGLMKAAGHPQVRFVDRITPRMPTPEEVVRLELPRGTAVAEHVRVGYNATGRPVRVIIQVLPGDRNVIVYEVSAE